MGYLVFISPLIHINYYYYYYNWSELFLLLLVYYDLRQSVRVIVIMLLYTL